MVQKIPGHISKYMQERRMVLDQEGFENVQFLTLLFLLVCFILRFLPWHDELVKTN